jgi:hypothetical protein
MRGRVPSVGRGSASKASQSRPALLQWRRAAPQDGGVRRVCSGAPCWDNWAALCVSLNVNRAMYPALRWPPGPRPRGIPVCSAYRLALECLDLAGDGSFGGQTLDAGSAEEAGNARHTRQSLAYRLGLVERPAMTDDQDILAHVASGLGDAPHPPDGLVERQGHTCAAAAAGCPLIHSPCYDGCPGWFPFQSSNGSPFGSPALRVKRSACTQ